MNEDYSHYPAMNLTTSYKSKFVEELIEEIKQEFKDYRYYNVGFGAILRSMIYGFNNAMLVRPEFRAEVKYELKIIMNYLHSVRDKNLIRDIKSSFFPILLVGIAGNRTSVKQIILSAHLSVKSISDITRTYISMAQNLHNHNADRIARLYVQMIADIRHVRFLQYKFNKVNDETMRSRKLLQVKKFKLRLKNNLRQQLNLPLLIAIPDDPYRWLPEYKNELSDFFVSQPVRF